MWKVKSDVAKRDSFLVVSKVAIGQVYVRRSQVAGRRTAPQVGVIELLITRRYLSQLFLSTPTAAAADPTRPGFGTILSD